MKITKCIIPVAGMGTRLLPITKTITKEMLPIVDEPVIYLQVKEAYLSGIRDIIFVVSKRNKKLVKNFFSKDSYLQDFIHNEPDKLQLLQELEEIINNTKFTYVIEKQKGSYGAIYSARKHVKDEFFGVMFGDDLVDSEIPLLKQLINENERTNDMVMAVHQTDNDKLPNYGLVKYKEENIIQELSSKEELPSNDVVHGRFIVHTNIFNNIDKLKKHKHQELYLPAAMLLTNQVRAYQYQGTYYDIGNKASYIMANIAYGLKRDNLKKDLVEFIKKSL